MKKYIIMIALSALAFAACTKENSTEPAAYSLTAIAPGNDDTKTSLSKGEGSNWNVLWSENDALRVKVSGTGQSSSDYAVYTLDEGAGTGSGVFKGTVEAPDNVFAFYPSSLVTAINSHGMFFNTPVNQTYVSGGVDNNSLPIFANGPKSGLSFNHTCAIINLQLYTNQPDIYVSNVVCQSTEVISGQRYFKYTDFTRPTQASSPSYQVSMDLNNILVPTDSEHPLSLYFIIGTVTSNHSLGDLTFTVQFSDGTEISKTKSGLSVEWGKVYKMAAWEVTKPASDLQINIDGSGWNTWDGGTITAPNSSVAIKGTNSRLLMKSFKNIISSVKLSSSKIDLDFSQVATSSGFYSIPVTEDLFESNKKIGDVILPEGITTIEKCAFENSSVDTLTIPATATSVSFAVLRDCGALSGFKVNSHNPKYLAIDGQLYSKNGTTPETYTLESVSCGKVGSYTIAPNTTVIGVSALQWCRSLTSLDIPSSVVSIESEAFFVTPRLVTITLNGIEPPVFISAPWNQNYTYWAGYLSTATKSVIVPAGYADDYEASDWKTYFVDQAGFTITTD